MSYIDFTQAHAISSIILEDNLHANNPRENRILLKALNSAMIVAYCRPFSGNDGRRDGKIPDLPGRFVRALTADEREIHDTVMADRNTVIAHSDSETWNMRPHYAEINSRQILVPLHHGVLRPLIREATERFNRLAKKQMESVFEARKQLEAELKKHLPVIKEEEEVSGIKNKSEGYPPVGLNACQECCRALFVRIF